MNDARRAESAEKKKKAVLKSVNEPEKVQMRQEAGKRCANNKSGITDKEEGSQDHQIQLVEDETEDWKYEDEFLAD